MTKYEYIPSLNDEHGETRSAFSCMGAEVRPFIPRDNSQETSRIAQIGQGADRNLQGEKVNWTEEKVIEELKKFVEEEGYSPSVAKTPDNLRGAAERHFESWNKAKEAAGIEQYPIGYNLDAKTKQNSNEIRIKLNLNPSPDLAYILGTMKGDGTAYIKKGTRSGYVRLKQMKKEFAESFKTSLLSIGLHPSVSLVSEKNVRGGKIFVTEAKGYLFAEWYKQLSFEDIEKILGNNLKSMKEFIRGFYESEGCNYIGRGSWAIIMVNTNKELVRLVQTLLQKLDFHFNVYERNGVYRIETGKKVENLRFIREIQPCIKNRIPIEVLRW